MIARRNQFTSSLNSKQKTKNSQAPVKVCPFHQNMTKTSKQVIVHKYNGHENQLPMLSGSTLKVELVGGWVRWVGWGGPTNNLVYPNYS